MYPIQLSKRLKIRILSTFKIINQTPFLVVLYANINIILPIMPIKRIDLIIEREGERQTGETGEGNGAALIMAVNAGPLMWIMQSLSSCLSLKPPGLRGYWVYRERGRGYVRLATLA